MGKEIELNVNGQKLTLDFEAFKAEQEWMKQKENEYWDYVFSGQRTIDLFGVEGAKRVLAEQAKREQSNEL